MKLVLMFDGGELIGATAVNDDEAEKLSAELNEAIDDDSEVEVQVVDPDPPEWMVGMLT